MTNGPIVYSAALRDDIPALFEMLMGMHAEGGFLPLDQPKALQKVASMVDNDFVIVTYSRGEMIGSIGIEKSEHWYSRQPVLIDRWTYVKPQHRRSMIAFRLIRAARNYARRSNMPLFMAVTSPHDTERKECLFARLMKPAGRIFVEDPGDVLRQ